MHDDCALGLFWCISQGTCLPTCRKIEETQLKSLIYKQGQENLNETGYYGPLSFTDAISYCENLNQTILTKKPSEVSSEVFIKVSKVWTGSRRVNQTHFVTDLGFTNLLGKDGRIILYTSNAPLFAEIFRKIGQQRYMPCVFGEWWLS